MDQSQSTDPANNNGFTEEQNLPDSEYGPAKQSSTNSEDDEYCENDPEECECDNCGDYVLKLNLYVKKPNDSITGNICGFCTEKCKECDMSFVRDPFYNYNTYEYDDYHSRDYFCCSLCASYWEVLKVGDPSEIWHENFRTGFDSYHYDLKRKN